MADPLALAFVPGVGYPYSTGYATVADVQARVNAGTWDPTKPTAAPTVAQVTNWLLEATACIDAALGKRGYYVPLTAATSWSPPPGMPTYQGIGIGAWLMLRNIAAAYATHFVEAARHGSIGQSQDQNADRWGTIYQNFLTLIEDGEDNLVTFGIGGPFAPEIDPARGASSGSLGFFLADPSTAESPIFYRSLQLGSGTETGFGRPPTF